MVQPSPDNNLKFSFWGLNLDASGGLTIIIILLLAGFGGIIYANLKAADNLNENLKWIYVQWQSAQQQSLTIQMQEHELARILTEKMERAINAQNNTSKEVSDLRHVIQVPFEQRPKVIQQQDEDTRREQQRKFYFEQGIK